MKILITACDEPDIDGVACAIAYANYLNQKFPENKYFAKFGKNIHIEAKFILEKLKLSYELIDDKEEFDAFILVDTAGLDGLPSIVKPEKVIEAIDHRLFGDFDKFPNSKFRIEPLGAAATQISEFYYFEKINLSPEFAQLLLCAIYSNTVNFNADVTNFRDYRMKEWLESFVLDKNLYIEMFDFKSKYALEHIEEVLISDDKFVNFENLGNTVIYQLEINSLKAFLNNIQELTDIVKKLRSEDNNPWFVLFQEMETSRTTIYTTQENVMNYFIEKKLPGNREGNFWRIDKIMMRKSIIPALK